MNLKKLCGNPLMNVFVVAAEFYGLSMTTVVDRKRVFVALCITIR